MQITMNFEWFMRFVSTSHFDSVDLGVWSTLVLPAYVLPLNFECLCCIFCQDPRQCRLGCLKYPISSICAFPLNFEWFMRFVSTSHFDWVAISHTVCNGVLASTVGTKDPLSSDGCSSSGRSEFYPPLSVGKIKVICQLSLLWVQSGMCSMHVCVVYPVKTRDSGM